MPGLSVSDEIGHSEPGSIRRLFKGDRQLELVGGFPVSNKVSWHEINRAILKVLNFQVAGIILHGRIDFFFRPVKKA